ncbi:MAG: hypothetical protein M1828_004110 [Chrysothrix sp. TS-e1954]|nr:MAG: hypothetical protein M1828_004110 [Chrysothrix sp. TS-e1954]
MDNTVGFEADADIDSSLRRRPESRNIDTNRGQNATMLATGGVAVDEDPSERTALLSGERDQGKRLERVVTNEWPGQKDFEGLPWWKRPSIFWMIPPFFLFTLAFGGIVAPKLNLINDLLCREYYAKIAAKNPGFVPPPIMFGQKNDQCTNDDISASVAQFTLAGNLIAGLISAFTSPKLGALSDRYGRVIVIASITSGMLFSEVITICAATFPQTFRVYWLYVSFVIEGLCGSFVAGMALAHSYAADCTPPDQRNVAFGYFHGCLFGGIALGPLIGRLVIGITHNFVVIFYMSLVCHSIFALSLFFLIPESLSKKRQYAAREKYRLQQGGQKGKSLAFLRDFFVPLKNLYPTGPGSSRALRRNLVILASIDTTVFGIAMGATTVILIYVRNQFHLGVDEQMNFIAAVNITRVLCLLVILPLLTRVFRGAAKAYNDKPQPSHGCDKLDITLVRLGIFCDTIGYCGYLFSGTPMMFIISGCFAAIGGIASPTLQSSLTKHVPHDRVGQILGASGLLHALARVVAPTIFNALYSETVGKFSKAIFVLLTALFGLAFLAAWALRTGTYLQDVPPEEDEAPEVRHDE